MEFAYDDVQWFQEDHTRRELIGGTLYIDGVLADRTQRAVAYLVRTLGPEVEEVAGVLITHRQDLSLDEDEESRPDVLVVRDADAFEQAYPHIAPDFAVEVHAGAARSTLPALESYRGRHVAEVWFVDLDHDVIEAYVLHQRRYGDPVVFRRGDTVTATAVPGFSAAFDRLVPPA